MTSSFNPATIHRLTAQEIEQILNSGIFISGSNRKKLEERLNHLQQYDRGPERGSERGKPNPPLGFPSSRGDQPNYFSKQDRSNTFQIRPKKIELKDIPKKVVQEDFPQFDSGAEEEKIKSKPKILNFKKIVDSKVINNNYDQDSDELFVDNNVVVDYHEIEQIYKSYAIDRIHLSYLDLSRKISILDSTYNEMKELFDYNGLLAQREIMKYCSYAYIQLKRIIALSESCIKILKVGEYSEALSDKIDELNELIPKMQYSHNPKFGEFVVGFNFIKRTFREFMKLGPSHASSLQALTSLKTRTGPFVEGFLEPIVAKSNELIKFLAEKFDPNIECEYHLEFKRQLGGNITPIGISKWGYHAFGNITMKLYEEEADIRSTATHLRYLFNQVHKSSNSNLIIIHSTFESPIPNTYIRFTIGDDIPFARGGVVLKNKPDGFHIMVPIITNPKLIPEIKERTPICPVLNYVDKWLNTRTRRELFVPSKDEYEGLNETIKSSYGPEDIDKNIFYVDKVFDQLLDYDGGDGIIEPQMINSFRQLAYDTS
jgi:hypothetical protein